MREIFVDTSGWLAILVSSDFHHRGAVEIYNQLLASKQNFLTHEGVLLELGNALSSVRSRGIVLKLLARIAASRRIECVALDSQLVISGWNLYAERSDKDWGIVDCISFVLMERRAITDALTADKHFEQAGFSKLLKSLG